MTKKKRQLYCCPVLKEYVLLLLLPHSLPDKQVINQVSRIKTGQ